MRSVVWAVLCVLLSTNACTDQGVPIPVPRIVPGRGVDGVDIGFSRDQAWKVLGDPPEGGGLYDGPYRGGEFDRWESGPHAGIQLYYYQYFVDYAPVVGPVDFIFVTTPFSGVTAEGVGIGSTLTSVLQIYPSPRYLSVDSTGYGRVYYCMSGKYFLVRFRDSTVKDISLCFYAPPKPGEMSFSCP